MSPLSRQFQSLSRKPLPISCSFGRSAAQVITNGSINDRHLRREHRRQVYAACASWLRARRRSLRKLGSVQASKDGRPRGAARARASTSIRPMPRRGRQAFGFVPRISVRAWQWQAHGVHTDGRVPTLEPSSTSGGSGWLSRGRNESRYPERIQMCVVAPRGMLREAEHFRRRSAQSPSISIYVLPTYNGVFSIAFTWPSGSMYDSALAT